MTARRFDPEQNREEFERLYGTHPVNWDELLSRITTVDTRDVRDPEKLGRRILRKKGKAA